MLVNFCKKKISSWNFDKNCVASVDHVGKFYHPNSIKSSDQ